MLTDDHVGAGSSWINGALYNMVPGSAHQLVNPPGSTFTSESDVLIYQINGNPNLPSLKIGASAPVFGQSVMMIGNGRDRVPTESYWNNTDGVWSLGTPTNYVNSGYTWANTNEVRWGTNTVDGVGFPQGNGVTSNIAFSMSFSATNATPYEAIGTAGDSGGGVFSYNASTKGWELIGLMESYTQLNGEPSNVSAFGSLTNAIQLSAYRNQIMSYLTPGDLNGDSRVDIRDVTQVANNWMTTNSAGDVNHDGVVDIRDLTSIANDWGGVGGGATLVPEPETYALASCALLGMLPSPCGNSAAADRGQNMDLARRLDGG